MNCLKPYFHSQFVFKNRIVMPPMCMYQAQNGFVNPFHIVHYASRAIGGAGSIIVEATAVSPEGRITDQDLGIWADYFIPGLRDISDEIHRYNSLALIQLAHAGRKSQSSISPHIAPSAIAFSDNYETPVEMMKDEIDNLIRQFTDATRRALAAGFDGVEIHAAHGYLIHEFMSALSNQRTDDYGGNIENRGRLLHRIIQTIRNEINQDFILQVRVSASDYDDAGLKPEDVIEILRPIRHLINFVHVSSGGNVLRPIELKPGYQVGFATQIKEALNIPVIAVGLITELDEVESILESNQADFVALGRELLRNPYFALQAYDKARDKSNLPESYLRAYHQ